MGGALYRLWAMGFLASILIIIVLAVRFLLRRYPRIYSYCLWILVGIRLLCPVWVESPFSLLPDLSGPSLRQGQAMGNTSTILGVQAGETEGNTDMEKEEGQDMVFGAGQPDGALPESQSPSGQERGDQKNTLAAGPGLIEQVKRLLESGKIKGYGLFTEKVFARVSVLYFIGAAVVFLMYFIQYLWIRHRVCAAVREKGNVWLCDKIGSPFVMGVIFPRIYLPYKVSGKEKKYVLRHERTHIKHKDPLIRMIGTLCICLHWWTPLVWLAVYLMNQDMEMFCDETVLRHAPLEERKSYAQTLLSFAEKDNGFGAGLAFGESHTEKRIKNIMKKRKRSFLVVFLVAVFAIFCVAAFMTVPGTKTGDGKEGTAGGFPETEWVLPKDPSMNESSENGDAVPGQGELSDADYAYLMEVSPGVPNFTRREEMDLAFWENYLFNTYTSDFDREQVNRYSEQLGADILYIRVSFEEADEEIRQLFGENLSGYGISPETLGAGGSSVIYENGFLFIAASDSPAFQFAVEKVTTADVVTQVSLLKTIEDGEMFSHVLLYLLPAENERGFVLDGKEEINAPPIPEGQTLEGQFFEVEMNPYGTVTFAAYAPDVSVSPYADVTFKLLKDGKEIFAFPLQGTGVREDQAVFDGMAAVAFPDLNGDGYTDVVTLANYRKESGSIPPMARIFIYHSGGYFLEETYLEDAYNFSHGEKTIEDVEAFVSRHENQDYFVGTSIYGRWHVRDYKLSQIYALDQSQIDSLLGARLEYGIASLWTNVDGAGSVVMGYERETVTSGQLEEDFGVSSADLGIVEDELVYYQVSAQKDSPFGCFFYLLDQDHALIYYEGVFFEAERE